MPAAKIVTLNGDIIDHRQSSESVVKVLEDCLEKARAGEITGVALAFVYFDEAASYDCAGRSSHSLTGALYSALLAIVRATE